MSGLHQRRAESLVYQFKTMGFFMQGDSDSLPCLS